MFAPTQVWIGLDGQTKTSLTERLIFNHKGNFIKSSRNDKQFFSMNQSIVP